MPKKDTIKLSLEIDQALNAKLEEYARKANTSKSEVLRRSIGYYDIAAEAKDEGHKLGLLTKDRQLITLIQEV